MSTLFCVASTYDLYLESYTTLQPPRVRMWNLYHSKAVNQLLNNTVTIGTCWDLSNYHKLETYDSCV